MKAFVSALTLGFTLFLSTFAQAEQGFLLGTFIGDQTTALITKKNPGYDTYIVECSVPTQIRAQLTPIQKSDVQVSVTCVAPESSLGQAGVEVEWVGKATNSEYAKVNNCQKAVMVVSTSAATDPQAAHSYSAWVECLNTPLIGGFNTVITNR